MACIYKHPHGSINVTELDAILNHNNKTFLFGDFNAKHPSWNPGRAADTLHPTDEEEGGAKSLIYFLCCFRFALQSNTRAIGDEPRQYEPRSSQDDDISVYTVS
ncbi:hypothetical protein TNCV_251011 [Trichonephila clavipes]|nr:hypothetical protein TNCV_251011 [Trichonephila clavipes]